MAQMGILTQWPPASPTYPTCPVYRYSEINTPTFVGTSGYLFLMLPTGLEFFLANSGTLTPEEGTLP